jgi:hypothetical protein
MFPPSSVAEVFHAGEGQAAQHAAGLLIRFLPCQIIRRVPKPSQRHRVVSRRRLTSRLARAPWPGNGTQGGQFRHRTQPSSRSSRCCGSRQGCRACVGRSSPLATASLADPEASERLPLPHWRGNPVSCVFSCTHPHQHPSHTSVEPARMLFLQRQDDALANPRSLLLHL